MSLGAEKRMENRLKKLEGMIRDPRSPLNLESLVVSQVGYISWIIDDAMLFRLVCNVKLLASIQFFHWIISILLVSVCR